MTMEKAQEPAVAALTRSQPPATSATTATAATRTITRGALRNGASIVPVVATKRKRMIHCAPSVTVVVTAMVPMSAMRRPRTTPWRGASARPESVEICRCCNSTAVMKQAANTTSAPPASQAGWTLPLMTSDAGPASASRKR